LFGSNIFIPLPTGLLNDPDTVEVISQILYNFKDLVVVLRSTEGDADTEYYYDELGHYLNVMQDVCSPTLREGTSSFFVFLI
jgi:hypothetical protein